MIVLVVAVALAAGYFLFFYKPGPKTLVVAAPQVVAGSAPVIPAPDANAAARAYAARFTAETLGRIIAFEDLQKLADQARQAVEAADPNGPQASPPAAS